MCQLQRNIKRLQRTIAADKAHLQVQGDLLKTELRDSWLLPIAMVGGLGCGFLLGQVKFSRYVKLALRNLPFLLKATTLL